MKILFVNEYSYPNVVSGAEFSMEALAEALTKSGNEITIISPSLGNDLEFFLYNNIKYYKFPFFKKTKPYQSLSPFWFNNPLFWLITAFSLLKIIKQENIDIIHVHGKFVLPGVILAKLLSRKPVVVTVRDYKFLCPLSLCFVNKDSKCDIKYFIFSELPNYLKIYEKKSNWFRKITTVTRIIISKFFQELLLLSLKKANKIICVSQAVLNIYKKSGISSEKLISIYNVVDISSKVTIMSKNKTIISVGKISYGKGSDILIDAFEKVKKIIPDCQLIMVGAKSPSIEKIPENVEYIKKVDHDKIHEIYKKAGLFVLMSRWPEPLSRASLEAMSQGIPLILSDKGGNQEVVVDGVNGYLIKVDSKVLAQKIIKLFSERHTLQKMAESSSKIFIKKFSEKKSLDDHLKIYERLIK